MRVLITILTLLVLNFAANAAGFEKTAKAKAIQVVMSAEKPLVVGINTIKLHVANKGEAVDGDVTVKVFMPAMPGMPYMEEKAAAKALGSGNYEAQVALSMGGTWQIHIFVTTKSGKKYRVKSSLNI